MTADTDRPAFLLVHGAWHGAWCWDRVRTALDADGWRSHAVDLPSSAAAFPREDARPPGMLDDADAIRDGLRRIDGPVVVVAHSYGGVPASRAATATPDAALAIPPPIPVFMITS